MKSVFLYSLHRLSEICLIINRNERGMINSVSISIMYSIQYSCQIFQNLEFSRKIFFKCSNFIKIHPVGTKVFHADGRTHRHDKAKSRFHGSANATTTLLRWIVHWELAANRVPPQHNSYHGSSSPPSKYTLNAKININKSTLTSLLRVTQKVEGLNVCTEFGSYLLLLVNEGIIFSNMRNRQFKTSVAYPEIFFQGGFSPGIFSGGGGGWTKSVSVTGHR
jgi:hypothetical protein